MIKKSIIVFCFSAVSLLAEKEVGLSLGAGTVLKSSPYKNGKNKLFVLPYIDGKYENFYIRGLEAGYRLYTDESKDFKLFTKGDLGGYKESDADILSGMDERKNGISGGIGAAYKTPYGKLGISVSRDVSGAGDGYFGELEYSKNFNIGRGVFVGYVGIDYMDSKSSNYYYGIKVSEAAKERAAYEPNGAFNGYIGGKYIHFFDKNIFLFSNIKLTRFDDSIAKSDIVDKKYNALAAIAVGYKF
mgnify:FL=1